MSINHIKLLLLVGVLFVTLLPANALIDVSVDTSQQYQTISAWEASTNFGVENPDILAGYDSIKDEIYRTAIDDAGVTRLRVEMRAGMENDADYWTQWQDGDIVYQDWRCRRYRAINDNADPYSIDWSGFYFSEFDDKMQYVKEFLDYAQAHGKPVEFNLIYIAFTKQQNNAACPSYRFEHDQPEEYAEFIQAATLHLQQNYGITPDYYEIILEPDNTPEFPGTYIGEVTDATRRRLESMGITPRFILPSNTNAGTVVSYLDDALTAQPSIQPYIEEVVYHLYGDRSTSTKQSIATRAQQIGANTAMLEWMPADHRTLADDLRFGQVSSWQRFGLAAVKETNYPSSLLAIDTSNPSSMTVDLRDTAVPLAQVFRYVRPGAVRVGAVASHWTHIPLAFINPNGSIALAISVAASDDISVSGLPAGTYGMTWGSTTGVRTTFPDQTISAGESISATTTGEGVLTIFEKTASSAPDTTPPVIHSPSPTGTLPSGTTSTTLSVRTNENANCRYSTTSESYATMTDLSSTGGLSHSTPLSGLSDGTSYDYYIRCEDNAGNQNTNDFMISFSVNTPQLLEPILAYTFETGTATDVSGNGLDGTLYDSITATGVYGNGILLGNSGFIDMNSPSQIDDLGPYTLTLWIKDVGNSGYVVSKRDSCSGYWRLGLYNGQLEWFHALSASPHVLVRSATTLPTDTWTHVALSWDGTTSSNAARIYIDGQEASYERRTAGGGSVVSDASCSLRVGSRQGTGSFLASPIDEVRIYDRVLSPAEINEDMQLSYEEGTPEDNQQPSVSITTPSQGASFSEPADIMISASATDNDGSITSMQFELDGQTKIDYSAPYSVTYTAVSQGLYTIRATATDNQGATNTDTITISVSSESIEGDVNGDGVVNLSDLDLISQNYGLSNFDGRADPTGDGKVDIFDLVFVALRYGNA